MSNNLDHTPSENPSAGEMLKNELKHLGLTQKQFAEMLGMSASHLSEIIKGHRGISVKLADKLQVNLNIPAAVWLKVQSEYNISQKELTPTDVEEKENRELLAEYDTLISIKEIFKKSKPTDNSAKSKISVLQDQYHLPSPVDLRTLADLIRGRFRKSAKKGLDERMILTWIILATHFADAQQHRIQARFEKSSLPQIAYDLRKVFHDNRDTIKTVSRVMASYGINFCVADKLDHASIDGYSYINDNGIPTIVVTMRYKRIDFLAFAVLHEVCHVYKHLNEKTNIMVSLSDYDNESQEEEDANNFAADALIPQAIWALAPAVKMNPYLIQHKYTTWAEQYQLNKWIVLGRVSHETGMYKFKADESRNIH